MTLEPPGRKSQARRDPPHQRGGSRRIVLFLTLLVADLWSAFPAGTLAAEFPAEGVPRPASDPNLPQVCPGWFPDTFGLKDHTVFWHKDAYYIASIYLGEDEHEDRFAYATSADLCHWTLLDGILRDRPAGGWDEFRIWAPFVYEENGVYYLFYTGVTQSFAQSIMLATSSDPADAALWTRQGVVFQPSHSESVWGGFDTWSDCRDATVVKAGATYFMYYTGLDLDGGIVGLATAPYPAGPWTDWGALVTDANAMLESPTLVFYGGLYYLFYNASGPEGSTELYHYGPTPAGPWSTALPLYPGWAHEIWTGPDQNWYTSFLTDYSVTIRPLTWNDFHVPPRPFIGPTIYRQFLPAMRH